MACPDKKDGYILVVDDEPNIRSALRRVLRPLKRVINAADGGPEALELIRREGPPKVIISDQCMPEMTGVEFLVKAKELCPDTFMMMLTARPDMLIALNAIDNGLIDRFMTKPWEDEKLRSTVRYYLEQ